MGAFCRTLFCPPWLSHPSLLTGVRFGRWRARIRGCRPLVVQQPRLPLHHPVLPARRVRAGRRVPNDFDINLTRLTSPACTNTVALSARRRVVRIMRLDASCCDTALTVTWACCDCAVTVRCLCRTAGLRPIDRCLIWKKIGFAVSKIPKFKFGGCRYGNFDIISDPWSHASSALYTVLCGPCNVLCLVTMVLGC